MKRIIALLTVFLLFSTSCTKNEAKLSDFVVGNWKSQNITLSGMPLGYFNVTINENTYVLIFTLSDGSQSITCPKTGYTVDNGKNQITIDEPQFDPQTPVSGTTTFAVSNWIPGGNKMTWTPVDTTGNNPPPTINWTRQ